VVRLHACFDTSGDRGCLGVLGRMHAIELPPSLDVVTRGWVVGACVALYFIEFVADKIPGIDQGLGHD
jgi:hypothetical protein